MSEFPKTESNTIEFKADLTDSFEKEVVAFLNSEKGFTINDSFLNNLDFYTPDGELNYVAYLFADVNSASFNVAKYSGKDKIDLIENEEYGYCSLIKATNRNRILDKLEIENKTFTKITGAAQRLQKRMIDRTALREALINAMVHNDYCREGRLLLRFILID